MLTVTLCRLLAESGRSPLDARFKESRRNYRPLEAKTHPAAARALAASKGSSSQLMKVRLSVMTSALSVMPG